MTPRGRDDTGTIPQVTQLKIPSELVTERLRLRTWRTDDLDELAAVFAQPEVWHYPLGRGMRRDETERFLERQLAEWEADGFGRYAVEVDATGELAGYAGLQFGRWFEEIADEVEVGWRFGRQFWGRGIATEAAFATLAGGFGELGRSSILAVIEPDNHASVNVARRLAMTWRRETVEPQYNKRLAVYELGRAEFLAASPPRAIG